MDVAASFVGDNGIVLRVTVLEMDIGGELFSRGEFPMLVHHSFSVDPWEER